MALDIGKKRTGVAETDAMQIIAQAVETIATAELIPYLEKRLREETYEAFVLGEPKDLKGGDTHNSSRVREIAAVLKKKFPALPVHMADERFSSRMAMQRLVEQGVKKGKRREKGSLDAESAAIILEGYLQSR